ncbi:MULTISPECIES: CDP-diacylglycerol--glycerol-3-phosphate 3-phosphatidyltransferase [Methylomonas]|uniref:CDP-diacylglycerol--glycerol-3-phosphate 3-phosphatidyltransferase n=1 Tax=Methylomonas koyamae TaxID=702114 RepID=A0A291IL38_9GAMM|nr:MULTISPECIES: CDP-diacylglycerol--glycerol-3-phosphate 3-phosphatidyltransferase [Methylomonas]ANE56002.1 CDP-diacylglycerol--glycerol-3-phosphate 3-phosphatidyltransferase [Methylomonas sp. DH-1]ATG90877.1 CDP-diacylglycerol--glycerol-3-phosphate 3-phosphatidyltransferase [Methylomonas koyamae]OAI29008.1 CDP-diacylglycerol--glycerol-3-phosphate 3-phosphatidyltransferase [Methylomonas koyamae]WNB77597.1 CDP-diacylglycerol--glycerol-3-phosphate 3-phosphatidyltransferase [Methylomonas koyamae]
MAIRFTIPTYLTLLRIALIPLLAVVFYLPWQYSNIASTLIFLIAGVTDWLDGYLARKMNMQTAFGAFLDPVADKLMVAIVLVLIVQEQGNPFLAVPAAVIIGREIAIASLREWMAEIGQRAKVKVSVLGKWKTTAQMTAVSLLLYREDLFGLPINSMGYWLLYLSAILTLWSMVNYLVAAFSTISE